MKYKEGVSPVGLHWRIRRVLKVADSLWKKAGHELVVTAACEDGHSEWSWHPYGCAVDLRTRDIPSLVVGDLVIDLRNVLRAPYQIIHHDTHLHIEYDPVAFGHDHR